MTATNSNLHLTKTKIILHRHPDQGWSWVIAISCCFINAIIFGIYRTHGVIFVALLNHYGVSREVASWPFSLCLTIFHMTGLVSGALSTYFNTRSITMAGCLIASFGISCCYFATSVVQVGILIGLFNGFGMGLVGTQTPVIINQYFVKYRATATGIALAGGTIGSFVFPPLVKIIISEYSLRGCFLILGAIMLNTLPVSVLLRPPKPKAHLEDIGSKTSTISVVMVKGDDRPPNPPDTAISSLPSDPTTSDHILRPLKCYLSNFLSALTINGRLIKSLLKNHLFVILCLTQIAFTWGWTTYLMVVVDFAVDRGVDMSISVMLLSAFAGADLCGRLGSGWISDKGLVRRKDVARLSIFLIGVLLSMLPRLASFPALFTISLLLGLFSGSIMILFSILLVEYVGIEKMPVALGTSTFTCGMATMLRPAVIGYFRDTHNSYDGLFAFLSGLCFFSSCLWILEPGFKLVKRYLNHDSLTVTDLKVDMNQNDVRQ